MIEHRLSVLPTSFLLFMLCSLSLSSKNHLIQIFHVKFVYCVPENSCKISEMKENTFALIKLCLDLLLTFPYRNDKLEMKSHNETVDLLHGGYGHG